MRPHVEIIHEKDYVWHNAELVAGSGRASERRLSVDEEDGSSSLRIDFNTDWSRSAGIHHANTEYFVIEGEMRIGNQTMGKGGYIQAPQGVPMDSIFFKEGTQILQYREYGDAGFDVVDSVKAPRWADASGDITIKDTEAMKWDEVPNPGPMPGLLIKYLKIDPITGFYTRLVRAREGWTDHRLAHHPCYEEAYTLQGHQAYNFGDTKPGVYFFRPARVKHGHFVTMEGGATWLIRSDGELQNWYSQNEWVRWGAEAVNYGPNGGRMTWSQSSHDLAQLPSPRTTEDLNLLKKSVDYQRSLGNPDVDYLQHGEGKDKSLVALGLDHDHSHGEDDHDHGHAHAEWPDPRSLEHEDERTGEGAHEWGKGRTWKAGMPIPAPIISTLPVRSRSTGRWDGDGM